ncbi:MAG: DUF927 domain-containing protein [Planctomycetaceae bacterium]|nr:DUF927 domain-containing protein [Planctomycetaceae bacterium]
MSVTPSASLASSNSGSTPAILLASMDAIRELNERLCAGHDAVCDISGVWRLPRGERLALCRLIQTHRDRLRFRTVAGDDVVDPLSALSDAGADDGDLAALVTCAVELVAARCGNDEQAEARIADFVQAIGARRPRALTQQLRRVRTHIDRTLEDQPQFCDLLQQVAAADDVVHQGRGLVLPSGWWFDAARNQTRRLEGPLRSENVDGLEGVLFVPRKSRDPHSGELMHEVYSLRHGQLHRHRLERQQLLRYGRAESLCSLGLPVSSANARLWVHYFMDYFRDNDFRLQELDMTTHLGWQPSMATPAFLCGNRVIQATDVTDGVNVLELAHTEDAFQKIADAYGSHGSAEASLELLREAGQYPVVWFAAMSSLASVLLAPLNSGSFIVDLCGETSSGKSITLEICGSLWGRVGFGCEDAVVHQSWDATRVYVERRAAFQHSLPLFLDDTRTVKSAEVVGQICYDLANGCGRGRGNVTGITDSAQWNLVTISTGEQSLTSFDEQAGLRARIITFRGSPFTSQATRQVVQHFERLARHNCGHVGPRFVEQMIARRAEWPAWQQRLNALKETLAETFATNRVAGRQVDYLAIVELTAELFCDWFGFPDAFRTPSAGVRELLLREYGDADRPREALEHLLDYVALHADQFLADGQNPPTLSHMSLDSHRRELSGRRIRCDGDPEDAPSLAITKTAFAQVMAAGGFSVDEVLTAWQQRGWIRFDRGRQHYRNTRLGGAATRCVCVRGPELRTFVQEREESAGPRPASWTPRGRAPGTLPSLPVAANSGNSTSAVVETP